MTASAASESVPTPADLARGAETGETAPRLCSAWVVAGDRIPFAKSGAPCSNNLTARPFPSLFEDELPLYFTQTANGSLKLDPAETIYTLWIGTNDVGDGALLTGHGAPGVTVVDTVTCAVNWVQTLYDSGARNFIFQNVGR